MNEIRTTRTYYQVDKEAIGFIRFIFEGYDGIAVVTTENRATGVIILTVAPGCASEVMDVVESLKPDIVLRPIDRIDSGHEIIY